MPRSESLAYRQNDGTGSSERNDATCGAAPGRETGIGSTDVNRPESEIEPLVVGQDYSKGCGVISRHYVKAYKFDGEELDALDAPGCWIELSLLDTQ